MKNLAGKHDCDETILEELYLAGLKPIKIEKSDTEVPYRYIAKFGNWTFRGAWYYWVARVEKDELGLPLDVALELYNKKQPFKDVNLGEIIRAGGDAGCESPDGYVSQPIYNEEFNEKLIALGYKKEYSEALKMSYIPINYGQIAKLCNEGKLDVKRYVDTYHIDDQIGLNEFVSCIINLYLNSPDKYDGFTEKN